MKKILLIIVATMFVGNLFAQDFKKNIFGIRAGVNYTANSFSGLTSIENALINTMLDNKIGYNAGFSYERLLTKKFPLYLETGLHYSRKGCELSSWFGDEEYHLSWHFIEIPLMLNYKFNIGKSFAIYPSAGLYVGYSVAGTERYRGYEENGSEFIEKDHYFFEDGEILRLGPDFGYRCSISFALKRFVLSAGYEKTIKAIKNSISYDDDDDEIILKGKYSNYFISLGINF